MRKKIDETVIKRFPNKIKHKIFNKILKRRILHEYGDDPNNLDLEEIAIRQHQVDQQIFKLSKIAKPVKFENGSLIMMLPNSTQASIDFTDKRGNRNMIDLFGVFFYCWQMNGVLVNGWRKVDVSKGKIRELLSLTGRTNVTDRWIKDTISNIRKFKIRPSRLKDFVGIDYYDRKTKVYPFRIKQAWL